MTSMIDRSRRRRAAAALAGASLLALLAGAAAAQEPGLALPALSALPGLAAPAPPREPVVPLPTPAPVYADPAAGVGAADAKATLRRPPKLADATLCRPPAAASPPAIDWAAWDGGDPGVDPARMLIDAERLAEGSAEVPRDKVLARRMLERLAGAPGPASARAKRDLALLLVDPEAGAVDPARAGALLEAALAERETTAALALGRLNRDNRLPGASPERAAKFFSIAASFGDPRAGLEFAGLFGAGGAPEPFPGAADHYLTLALIGAQTALSQGDCGIVADVGDLLLGAPGREDFAAALPWYEVGDRIGDPVSELRLARLAEAGSGMPRDAARALALREEAAAHGSLDALTLVADHYLSDGRDVAKGLALAKRAAEGRSMSAVRLLARYQRGDFTGTPDFAAMNATLDAAIARPGASALLLADKATALLEGQGVPVDRSAAAALFQRVGAFETPEADLAFAGFLLREGIDRPQAEARLRRAAEAGNPLAMLEVSDELRCEAGPSQAEAVADWRRRAAEAGASAAMRRIGQVAADRGEADEARRWLSQAAEAGDRIAMVELAKIEAAAGGGRTAASWAAKAAAPGENVVEGRLALARAYASGELAAEPNSAEALLASVEASGSASVDLELGRLVLASARAGEPAWDQGLSHLRRAALRGNAKAMTALARLGEGAGNAADAPDASPRALMLRAARAGDPQGLAAVEPGTDPVPDILAALADRRVCEPLALVQMARLFRSLPNGQGTADAERALERARGAAEERARDLLGLGQAYASGLATGTPDPATAEALLMQAAKRGNMRAGVALAEVLTGGASNKRDGEALDWLRRAALAGEPSAVKALGDLADRRAGDARAFAATLATLKDLAATGNAEAMFAAGSILATQGEASRPDGLALLERAAKSRHVGAMKMLAQLHAAGLAGAVSAGESTKWTRAAAEMGDPEAMFRYALALDLGFGVAADHAAATTWHERARSHGFEN
ncbi:tetratricopeptide repeat protein [Antarcticirhabdus aurantiaca]|uniref:Tetratricopeptide repeat protein n=1 Tax=Antarcticirhabdus aurantiaca TaxID=2606717 RepID=A0ACD4NPI7_9HYPH|nr:tetratricopeptide repeat protein [Antarcticirhabdus aurantiaca]WAJ28733.1 tetratricopeptide repeat protein [Jeongeuplla avenae]